MKGGDRSRRMKTKQITPSEQSKNGLENELKDIFEDLTEVYTKGREKAADYIEDFTAKKIVPLIRCAEDPVAGEHFRSEKESKFKEDRRQIEYDLSRDDSCTTFDTNDDRCHDNYDYTHDSAEEVEVADSFTTQDESDYSESFSDEDSKYSQVEYDSTDVESKGSDWDTTTDGGSTSLEDISTQGSSSVASTYSTSFEDVDDDELILDESSKRAQVTRSIQSRRNCTSAQETYETKRNIFFQLVEDMDMENSRIPLTSERNYGSSMQQTETLFVQSENENIELKPPSFDESQSSGENVQNQSVMPSAISNSCQESKIDSFEIESGSYRSNAIENNSIVSHLSKHGNEPVSISFHSENDEKINVIRNESNVASFQDNLKCINRVNSERNNARDESELVSHYHHGLANESETSSEVKIDRDQEELSSDHFVQQQFTPIEQKSTEKDVISFCDFAEFNIDDLAKEDSHKSHENDLNITINCSESYCNGPDSMEAIEISFSSLTFSTASTQIAEIEIKTDEEDARDENSSSNQRSDFRATYVKRGLETPKNTVPLSKELSKLQTVDSSSISNNNSSSGSGYYIRKRNESGSQTGSHRSGAHSRSSSFSSSRTVQMITKSRRVVSAEEVRHALEDMETKPDTGAPELTLKHRIGLGKPPKSNQGGIKRLGKMSFITKKISLLKHKEKEKPQFTQFSSFTGDEESSLSSFAKFE